MLRTYMVLAIAVYGGAIATAQDAIITKSYESSVEAGGFSLPAASAAPISIEPLAVEPISIGPLASSEQAPAALPAQQQQHVSDQVISTKMRSRNWIPLPEGIFPPLTGPTPEEHRHLGLGKPLTGATSWNAMPHSAGFYVGGIDSGQSLHNRLTHHLGTTFGMRFGIDYDYHWGIEKRFGFASMDSRHVNVNLRDQTELEFGDIDLYYYPWGDSQWRPFVMCGLGLSRFNHEDDQEHIERYLLTSPFGIGLKRLVSNGWSLRMEIADNLMIGNGEVGTMNNMSLAGGAEFRYHGFRWVR